MSSVNKVILMGRLGSDPKMNEGKTAVANISLATSEKWKDKAGKQQEKTEWHNVVFFGKVAEIAGKYLKKGSQIYIEGKLQTSEWTDKDGNKKRTTQINAHELKMLGAKGESTTQNKSKDESWDEFNDKIPF